MAAPIIKLKRSAVEGRIPSAANVPLGGLALNTYDGYLYASKDVGAGVTVIAINPWRVGAGTDAYNAYFTQGDVGIGTNNPTELLDVAGTTQTEQLNVTGVSTFTGDISIADKILHTGDTDTAIRFPAANTFTVETSGSEALRVDSSQNVGIGTNDPDTRLDVLPLYGRLRINDFSHIIFNNDNNSTTDYWGISPRDTWLALTYGTPNADTTIGGTNDIIRVQSSNGKVSVGKGQGGSQIYASSANLAIQATSNEVLDDSDGLHDLANPAFLHIRNYNSLATAESGILLDSRGSNPGAVAIYAKRTADNLGDLIFRFKSGSSASAERVRITSDGNLGINSTAPSEKLDVAGTTQTEQLNVTGVSTFAGKVNADAGLEVSGGVLTANNNINTSAVRRTSHTNTRIAFPANNEVSLQNSSGSILRVKDDRVGINSITPRSELDVRGNVIVSGISTFTGDVSFASTITFGDDDQIIMGDGSDLKLYHDGSNSYVEDAGTGALIMKGSTIRFRSTTNENIISASQNGSVDLYYDNSKTFETISGGIDVTGHTETDTLNVSGLSTFAGLVDINAGGQADTFKVEDLTSGRVVLAGTGGELEDSANLTFDGSTLTVNGDVSIGGTLTYEDVTNIDSLGIITARSGIVVSSGGLDVTGVSTFKDNVHLLDNDRLLLGGAAGTHDGLEIYHDGNHSYIDDSGTGNLYLRSGTLSIQNLAGSKTSVVFNSGGGQELYHNNSKKFETTGAGVTVTGALNVTGVATVGQSLVIKDDNHLTNDPEIAALAGTFQFKTDNNEVLRIDLSGNVGINRSNPQRKLDVEGDAIVRGNLESQQLNVTGVSTFTGAIDANGGIDVTGHTETDTLNVSGLSTFASALDINADVHVSGVVTATEFHGDGSNLTNITVSADPGGSDGQVQYNNGGTTAGAAQLYYDDTNDRFGINESSPDHRLHIQGNIGLRDHAIVGTVNNVTTTSTTQTTVAGLDITIHRSVEFLVQATEGTNYHVIKVLVIHDGTTAYNTQYGEMFTNTSVFSLDADVSGGDVRLRATSASANSTVYKVSFQSIKV